MPCFLLNFSVFCSFFWHRFSHRFLDAFLTKNRSKMSPKLSARTPPFSTFFEVVIFGGIFVDFGFTFGAPLAPFGLILVPFWFKLGPFWHPLGSFWCPFGSNWVPFGAMSGQILVILHPRGFVVARFGRNSSFKAVFCKKIHLH